MTTALDRAGQNGMRGDATPSTEPQVPGRTRQWYMRRIMGKASTIGK